jgi:two-component system KDP operon response regulator KdpE
MLTAATSVQPLILIVEDELAMRQHLRASLEFAGYRAVDAKTGKAGLKMADNLHPDLMIVDLGLPDIDGLEVVKAMRLSSKLPIIILSARGAEADKIAALDAGADDYVGKPFNMGELLARMRVALRRVADGGLAPARLRMGNVEIDLEKRSVLAAGLRVRLTPIEMRLLTCLGRHAGTVMTHRRIMHEVWGPAHEDQSHYLRIYMMNLRHKLEPDPAQPRYLITEPGVGYRLMPDEN